ncbi:MAG: DotU/TssL family secretion system protein [Candidatus Dactylopiibacterium sp.]|nr:DotU/TssL family secretion system protein [Candidatus Dactylopiibacterium sp.]
MTDSASRMRLGLMLRDTALQAVMLNDGAGIPSPAQWREHGIGLVRDLRQRLDEAGLPPAVADEISYAQCALLDECALKRTGLADAATRSQWESEPLQVKFFGSYNAGEIIYERIRALLHQAQRDPWLVDTYRTLLGLGFVGCFANAHDAERQKLVRALAEAAPAEQAPEVLIRGKGAGGWHRWAGLSPAAWLALAIGLTVALGWSLSHRLDALVMTLSAH